MAVLKRIVPCLWFDSEAEAAAEHYVSIFPNAKILKVARYTEVGKEFHGKEAGTAMTVSFELDGQPFTALNGGSQFKFSEAISLQIMCESQAEVDHYWDRLCEGGKPGPCGWLTDKFGLSWQVTPTALGRLLSGSDPAGVQRASQAMFQMQKLDIAALQRAYDGE